MERRCFFLSPHTPVGRVRLARFARVRLLRHALPISLVILRKKPTVLQSKQHEDAVKRPFGYLLIDLKTTTQDNCPLRTNVLGEEGFNQAEFQENISQELLKYLKQQNLSPVLLLPAMQVYRAT